MHRYFNTPLQWLAIIAYCLCTKVLADELSLGGANAQVLLIVSEDERCSANDGKLISLLAQEPKAKLKVWVDRWFMEVKSADHTPHILTAEQPQADLGCSNTYAGSQHWTIDSVMEIPQN